LGKVLGYILPAGSVVALVGELGSGKTCLAQGIIRGLGVREAYITSPTYVLIHEYKGRLPVYHFDLYRLDTPEYLEELGYEEYFYGSGVVIIEWADKIREFLPEEYLEVQLKKVAPKQRRLTLIPRGKNYKELLHNNSICGLR